MKRCYFLALLLVFLLVGPSLSLMGLAAEKPLVIGFEGDAATLDPHARSETTTTTIQRHV